MKHHESSPTYRMPPPRLAALLDAPMLPEYRVAPDAKHVLLLEPAGLMSLTDPAQPENKPKEQV